MRTVKKILTVVMIVVLALSCNVYADTNLTEEKNLLSNPGFELGTSVPDGGWTLRRAYTSEDWTLTSGVTWDKFWAESNENYQAQEGSKFIKFPTALGSGSVRQLVTGLEGGKNFEFSGYFNTSENTGFILYIYYYKTYEYNGQMVTTSLDEYAANTGNAVTGDVEKKVAFSSTNGNWQKLGFTFTLNPMADGAEVALYGNGATGTVEMFDNVSLVYTDNLLSNPSFEYYNVTTVTETKLDMYNWYESVSTTKQYVENPHSGSYAALPTNWGYLSQVVKIKPSTRYRLSYWYKVTTSAAASTVDVLFSNAAEGDISNTAYGINAPTASVTVADGWKKHVFYFTTPPLAQRLNVRMKSGATAANKMYDDVELVEIEDEREILGFTSAAPVRVAGTEGGATYPSELVPNLYGYTATPVTNITNGAKIYASATAPVGMDAVLLIGLFSENGNVRKLEAFKIVKPGANEDFCYDSITIPESGTYTAEAFLWNSVGEIVPVSNNFIIK